MFLESKWKTHDSRPNGRYSGNSNCS